MATNIIPIKPKTSAKGYRKRIVWRQRSRRVTQLVFAAFILNMSVVHYSSTVDVATPSIDALCPFGALQDGLTWLCKKGITRNCNSDSR